MLYALNVLSAIVNYISIKLQEKTKIKQTSEVLWHNSYFPLFFFNFLNFLLVPFR